jgi:hypothetical protein
LIFFSLLIAFNCLATDQVTAHLTRLTMPPAAGKGCLYVNHREAHPNKSENTHPDGASDEVLLDHFSLSSVKGTPAKTPT